MPITADHYRALLGDVRDEGEELISTLVPLTGSQWQLETPAVGWNIHDHVVHLAFFDDMATLALTEPAKFRLRADALLTLGSDWIDQISHARRAVPPPDVLSWFVSSRTAAVGALATAVPEYRSPWFGPPMSAASCATARVMETWAHSQDIHDAIGLVRRPGHRLRHVCHLGVLTRRFAYQARAMPLPDVDIRVELVAPDGARWTWGEEQSPHRITGDAADFAFVVTQRRHWVDTSLQASAGPAAEWLMIAQAFAGAPGPGRPPKSRASTYG